ncbi:MAG: hypothetical protein KKG99_08515 [Bacteroidetes bacterium]|nr:hypothetical protein [Bacteroidota bacterium]
MNFRRIEKLLEMYFDGDTSLEDEKILKEFFQGENLPPHLASLKDSFNYFSQEKTKDELDESFDQKLFAQINNFETSNKRQIRRRYIYYISGIAASILIIISIFTNIDPFSSKMKDTFNDPQVAYEETKNALLIVSGLFNHGLKPVDNIAKFDDGMNQLSKVESLSKGMEEVGKISKFYETQQKVINN